MEAKDKAKDLMQKAYDLDQYNKTSKDKCKEISLMVVNEIIAVFYFINPNSEDLILCEELNNWKKIREEITSL